MMMLIGVLILAGFLVWGIRYIGIIAQPFLNIIIVIIVLTCVAYTLNYFGILPRKLF